MTESDPLVNPLTGEVLNPAVLSSPELLAVQQQLEEWLGHNDVQRVPVWKASRRIQELLAKSPYGVPAPSRQTETQQKLARCPRCSGVLEVQA